MEECHTACSDLARSLAHVTVHERVEDVGTGSGVEHCLAYREGHVVQEDPCHGFVGDGPETDVFRPRIGTFGEPLRWRFGRPGHVERKVAEGYLRSVETDVAVVRDLHREVASVCRDHLVELGAWERFDPYPQVFLVLSEQEDVELCVSLANLRRAVAMSSAYLRSPISNLSQKR
jgi:hypothetical protein